MNFFYLLAISLSTLFSIPYQNVHTIAGIVKISPNQKKMTYAQLPCTEKNREQIVDMITTLGSNSYVSLLMNHKSRLEAIGEDVKHVHPLKFLDCIFAYKGEKLHNMKYYMQEIMDSSMTRSRFFDTGLAPSLTNEATKNNLNKYLKDFAKEIDIPVEKLQPFIDKKDWLGLLEFLIYYKH